MKRRHISITFASLLIVSLIIFCIYSADLTTETLPAPLEPEDGLLGTPFKYLIHHSCPTNVETVQIIHSFAGNDDARSAIRQAYPQSELDKLGIRRYFMLAALKPKQSVVTQEAIQSEDFRFGDIVQGSFFEAYKNLTYKHIMGLRWASECKVKYILKTDDDILVDLYSLVDVVRKKEFQLLGYTMRDMKPIRLLANKWYVHPKEYSKATYPTFLSGWLYVTSPSTARQLASAASSVPYLWIDDLLVTGILAEKLRIPLTPINHLFTYHPELFECCIRDGIKCGFLIGPNGGDHSLQKRFQQHSLKCWEGKCKTLPGNQTVEKICVAQRKRPYLGKGIAKFRVIKL